MVLDIGNSSAGIGLSNVILSMISGLIQIKSFLVKCKIDSDYYSKKFFGIHARSILGQGVRIHHRRASGPHIRIGIAPGCRHLHPGCRALSTPDVHVRNSGAGWERRRFNFSGRTYPDPPIAPTRRVSQTILYSVTVFS
uniref:Uncharacterized protein n=1 Tax=Vitis vinifera TaxID=29760 RepID=A5AKW4_VITVI|nr:hypothetical protein VITISV_028403 [Vitis vinifera]